MKYSRQRELIYQAVVDNPKHFTADEVFSYLKSDYPNLSLGTVYRNLNQLAQNGQILKIRVSGGGDRFDGRLDQHQHMECRKCGKVYDLESSVFDSLHEEVLRMTGFHVTEYDFMIYGVCADCYAAQKDANA